MKTFLDYNPPSILKPTTLLSCPMKIKTVVPPLYTLRSLSKGVIYKN